jgi:hypothetical protein
MLLLVSIGLAAQSKNGTIRGVVTDESKQVLPGVTVTLINVDTKAAVKTITNEKGEYKFETPAGTYTVGAYLRGFENINYLSFKLKDSETVPANFSLPVDIPRRSPQAEGRWIPLSNQ